MKRTSDFQVFLSNCKLLIFSSKSEVHINQLSLGVGFLNKTSIITRLTKKIMVKTGKTVIEPYDVPVL